MNKGSRSGMFFVSILIILVSVMWLRAENSVCNVCIGSRFEINSIDGIDSFSKKPKIYIKVNGKKVSAKILEYDSDSITCEWTKKVTAGTYTLYVWTKGDGEVAASSSFTVEEPVITSIFPCSGNTVGDEITITGYYFGTKKPKLWLEYTVRGKTEKSKCKIKTPLEYPDIKGKAGKSCMVVDTGESKIVFFAPKGIDEDSEYKLYLDNKISPNQTAFNTDTFNVTGSVTGAILEGVTITLTNGKGKYTGTTTTGVDGSFSFSELENGIYTVTPSLTDHSFSPENQTIIVNGSDINGINFRSQSTGTTDNKEIYFTDNNQKLGYENSYGIAAGDLDGDGDLDAFVANHLANKVWLNDGDGHFTDSGQELGNSRSQDVSLGDLDGDGDLDAFVANSYANKVWLNDGNGNFTDSGQELGNSRSQDVSLGDLDGDGDLDAFIANNYYYDEYYGANKVWLNDGNGNFTDSGQELGLSYSMGVSLGDLDGDGDLDAFIANSYYTNVSPAPNNNEVWLNDGNGFFTDSGQVLGSADSQDVSLGDLDGDGDLDAVIANDDYIGENKVWLNDGHGNFTDSGHNSGYGNSNCVQVADFNGDGHLDIIVVNAGLDYIEIDDIWMTGNRIWLNDGTGKFTDSGFYLGYYSSSDVAVGDFDGNGKPDAFVANCTYENEDYEPSNKVWLNGLKKSVYFTMSVDPVNGGETEPALGTTVEIAANQTYNIIAKPNPGFSFVKWSISEFGALKNYNLFDTMIFIKDNVEVTAHFSDEGYFFSDSGQSFENICSSDVALGDLDGDGDLDAVVSIGNLDDFWLLTLLNDGSGYFTENQRFGDGDFIELGDLDGDGDLDAFTGSSNSSKVWLNDGRGTFTDTEQQIGDNTVSGVALGDLDGDGDLDAFLANGGTIYEDGFDTIWLNDGKGYFTDSGQKLGSCDDYSADVKLADLDGDGDLDAFIISYEYEDCNVIYLNDGNGIFTSTDQYISSYGVALGDLDGDGDIDAFVVEESDDEDNYYIENQVWLNNGKGKFTSRQEFGIFYSYDVALGDLDGDGDLDAFVANYYDSGIPGDEQPNVYWENDGKAVFTAKQYVGNSDSARVALGDLNGDTSIDVFVVNVGPDKVWFNRAKH